MKKIAFILLLSFNTICSYASPDRIGDEGGSSFLDTLWAIIIGVIALPVLFVIAKEGMSDSEKDGKTTGLVALLAIVAFIIFLVVKCS